MPSQPKRGRPRRSKSLSLKVSVSLTATETAFLKALGSGSVSRGIHVLIERAKQ